MTQDYTVHMAPPASKTEAAGQVWLLPWLIALAIYRFWRIYVMDRYGKGARAERELLAYFKNLGYSVIRSAGSGVNSISPDIIVMKGRAGFAFECKAWDNGRLQIDHEKFRELRSWEDNTMLEVYMAWRVSNDGWYFIKPSEMAMGDRYCSVTMRSARQIGRRMESLVQQAEVQNCQAPPNA